MPISLRSPVCVPETRGSRGADVLTSFATIALLLTGLLLPALSAWAGTLTHRIVMKPGDAAPGVPGLLYEVAAVPAISPIGKIVFIAALDSNGQGTWVDDDGIQSLVAFNEQPTPVSGFEWGFNFGSPNINTAGRVATPMGLKMQFDGFDTGAGIFVQDAGGVLQPIALNGQATPLGDGSVFLIQPPSGGGSVMNDDFARVAFTSTLGGTATSANDESLWFHDGTQLHLVAREGDPAPGGGTFSSPLIDDVVLGGNGHLLFKGEVNVGTSEIGLYLYKDGAIQRLALTDAGFPGLGAGFVISSMFADFIRVNRLGQVAFTAGIDGPDPDDGDLVTFLSGSEATDWTIIGRNVPMGQTGLEFAAESLSDRGEVVSYGGLRNADGSSTAHLIRATRSNAITLVAEGDPAPGTSQGETFGDIYWFYVNSVGQYAIYAELVGGDTNRFLGIWAGSGPDDLELVVRMGDTINGQFTVNFPEDPSRHSQAGTGRPSLISDTGEILWTAVPTAGGGKPLVVSYFGDPPPPAPELVGLEAVQVIQDWSHSVPLYEGKPTLVRAHIKSSVSQNAEIVLRVFDDMGMEFPFSPLPNQGLGGLISLRTDGDQLRRYRDATPRWQLPPESLTGNISLKVENLSGPLDCGEVAGLNPADCTLELSFQTPQVPQLRIIALEAFDPYDGQNRVVDRAGRLDLVDRLISAYPINRVDWDDRQIPWVGSPNLKASLHLTRRLRSLDKCSEAAGCRRMYYSVFDDYDLAGVAYLGGYAGTGYLHPDPQAEGRHTHSHEIGHNLSRPHSVADPPLTELAEDGDKLGPCGSDADPMTDQFPFLYLIGGELRQTLGPFENVDERVYGWDALQDRIVDPYRFFDLMGYCSGRIIDLWPSKHTYAELATKLDERYTVIRQAGPSGTGMDYVLVSGTVDGTSGMVDLVALDRLGNSPPPEGSPTGTWTATLVDGADSPLSTVSFEPENLGGRGDTGTVIVFTAAIPDPGGGAGVEIRDDMGTLVASRAASDNPPTVTLNAPNGGETLSTDTVTVSWTSSDIDGDALSHKLLFSADNGVTWTSVLLDVPGQSADLPRAILGATSQGLLRVVASDGFLEGQDDSDTVFTVTNTAPTVSIQAPLDEQLYLSGESIELRASAHDTEDGALADAAFSWGSDLDGALGTGAALTVAADSLTAGDHLITVTATDGSAATGIDTVPIRVQDTTPTALVDIALQWSDLQGDTRSGSPHVHSLSVTNDGPDTVTDLTLTMSFAVSPPGEIRGPSSGLLLQAPAGWACSPDGASATCTAPDLEPFSEAIIEITVQIDQEARVTGTASFTSSLTDRLGANDTATVVYRVGPSDLLFRNGFEL